MTRIVITDDVAAAIAKLPPNISSKIQFGQGCWLWTGAGAGKQSKYGVACIGGGRRAPAHRFVYECLVGPIPEGLVVDHLCRCTKCVNPSHLEPVTNRENILRGTLPQLLKTHCRQGHPYSPENTFIRKGERPKRECVICRRAAVRKCEAAKRAARKATHKRKDD